jgi:arabinofuranosyltransferase
MNKVATAIRWGPLAACALILVGHSLVYDFVTDDAYISFVYTRNLVEHGELTFNPGDRVEGYTNFLWTVMLAIPMLVGIPPELSSRVLGTGFGIGTLVVVFRLTERLLATPERPRSRWAYLPPLLLACSSGFACWSSGGLETQLFTFLVTLAIERYVAADASPRQLGRVGVVCALAAMTRPEGLLVAAAIGVHRIAMNLARDRRVLPSADELRCVAGFLVVWAPWFAWRWWYYGWTFPNTYYVKATGAPLTADYHELLREFGVRYVWRWVEQVRLLWAAPLVIAGLVVTRLGSPRLTWVTLAVPLGAGYLAYTVVVAGGDFMGLHRFIMPVFVITAVLVTLGLERLAGLVRHPRGHGWVAAGAAAVVAGGFAVTQYRLTQVSVHPRTAAERSWQGIDAPGYLIAYTDNRAAIGRAMRDCFRDDDFSIVGGAGAQPYFGRMRGIDVFGLVSDRIAHRQRPHNPRPGHNKWGSNQLLASYDPSFVFSCYAIHSAERPPRLPCAGGWPGFEVVTLRIPGLDGKREGRDDARGGAVADRYTFLAREGRELACPGR